MRNPVEMANFGNCRDSHVATCRGNLPPHKFIREKVLRRGAQPNEQRLGKRRCEAGGIEEAKRSGDPSVRRKNERAARFPLSRKQLAPGATKGDSRAR